MSRRVALRLDGRAAAVLVLSLEDGRLRYGRRWPAALLALQQALDALPANGGQSGSVAVITLAGADGLTDDAAMTYSIAETADRLGVSARTVRRMIAGGRLPTVTLNRRRRIPAAALEEVGR